MGPGSQVIGKSVVFGPIAVTAETVALFHTGILVPTAADAAVAHPMFAATQIIPGTGMVLFQPGADFNINRAVHAGIDIQFHTPILIGARLGTSSKLLRVEEKSAGQILHIGFETRDEFSHLIVTGETRYLLRAKKSGESSTVPEGAEATRTAAFQRKVPTLPNQSVLYAEGSGDRFPIHTDDAFARSVGLPGVIMHGMCTLALSASAVISEALGGDLSRLGYLSCKFTNMVLPGDSLRVLGYRQKADAIEFESFTSDGRKAISEGVLRTKPV